MTKEEKAMIDKACKWLRSNIDYYWGDESYMDEIIEDFQKAMESEK